MEGILVQELHRLQMRVELLHHGELLFQKVLDDVPHCYIVWQSDSVANGDELSSTITNTNITDYSHDQLQDLEK